MQPINRIKPLTGIIITVFLTCATVISSSNPCRANNSYIDITEYGADFTGKENSSHLVNRLIDSLSRSNGGTIFFPAGNYLCGPIILKSNVSLFTDAGATIHFSDNFDDYLPMVPSRWEGVRVRNFKSPIYAIDAENISIKGKGHFDGNGQKWWDTWFEVSRNNLQGTKWQQIFQQENDTLLAGNEYISGMHNFLRPAMVMFYNCKRIEIEGVSFSNPPFWTISPTFSENITINNITITNPAHSPNTDGINPSSCKNVRISNCHISVGDDCIVLKSGRDADGRDAGISTENVTITNCTMLDGHGGVVIGSEMSGGVKRVTISNCVFEGTDRGIRLKTMRGRGGVVEHVRVSNIVMKNIVKEGIMINMRYHPTPVEPVSERTPSFRNIHFSNINILDSKKGIAFYGLEEQNVEDVTFTDFSIKSEEGISAAYAQNLIFDNIRLSCNNSTPLTLANCKKVEINQYRVMEPVENTTAITLQNCNTVKITDCFQPGKIEVFCKADTASKNIYIMNNLLPGAQSITGNKPEENFILFNNHK
ncbi:MAG: glycoside hydrolase family 28 protein [Prolixibacteraceae bacterium]|nr:glycoside hydrolase family 28 protein [Prolixibacteraceae bacterium]